MSEMKIEDVLLWKYIIDRVVLENNGYQFYRSLLMDGSYEHSERNQKYYREQEQDLYNKCLDKYNRNKSRHNHEYYLEYTFYTYFTEMIHNGYSDMIKIYYDQSFLTW